MDEFDRGMDPELKRYFRKIMRSFGWTLLWLLSSVTAGFFFRLAIVDGGIRWYNLLFYALFAVSFLLLIRFLFRNWRS